MFRVLVHLDRSQIGFLHFLLEGYDGLATTTTIDPYKAIVEIHVTVEQVAELQSLLSAVRHQLGISSIDQVMP